jgi:1,4-alpha-glucan branching enzyme
MNEGGTPLGATVQKNYVDFAVWAPNAQQVWVKLEIDEGKFEDFEMVSIANGIWETKIGEARVGMCYKYKIHDQWDNYLERNDPHARAMTSSVEGFSVITQDSFKWPDKKFRPAPRDKQVVYELHIGTFAQPYPGHPGTFNEAIKKMGYLKNLGVNMIEVMPVHSTPYYNDRGYGPSHLFSVEESLGGRVEFQRFVRSAHKHGIGVILDVVYNHASTDKNDLWEFDGWNEDYKGGIYFYNDDRANTPWLGPRFDYGRPEVRQYLLDNVRMWLEEFKLDGLRFDSTHHIRSFDGTDNPDAANPEGWLLLQEINRLAHKINPRAVMIAEDNSLNDYLTKPIEEGGAGFDAQWGLGFASAIRKSFGVGSWQNIWDLTEELKRYYNGDFRQKVIFAESHDTASRSDHNERLEADFDHDNHLSVWAQQKVLLATGIALTAPGVPMLFAGQEFMQPGEFSSLEPLDWNLCRSFWPNFTSAFRHLIDLRRNKFGNTDGLTGGYFELFHTDQHNHVVAYTRGNCVVIANFGDKRFDEYELTLPFPGIFSAQFNSSWEGYNPGFANFVFDFAETSFDNKLVIPLAEHSIIILSQ